MLRIFPFLMFLPLYLLFTVSTTQAIGIYGDIPVQFKFTKDCSGDCTFSPSGLKVGVVLPSNIGIGVESYSIHDDATTIKFEFLDISYLLPIPIVNITIGIGGGKVNFGSGSFDKSGNATQFWISAGFPIIPLFDLHVGFHKVDSSIHEDDITLEFNGNMISVGAMFNF
ncbi:MAG: hypothetical protein IIC64_18600 [SAR324 cluster bacterium]|nr:hypothetical protein [SAR324 cluster bacterium]